MDFAIERKVDAKEAGVIVGPVETAVFLTCRRVCFAILSAMKVADARINGSTVRWTVRPFSVECSSVVFSEPLEEVLEVRFDERTPRGDIFVVVRESNEAAGVMELRLMIEPECPLP